MASSSSPSSSSSSEDQKQQLRGKEIKECLHKSKITKFLGRTTPIVLQNDNGPCPLLAICNVLLLRNNLNLSPDTTEVSQEKLLSLIAERLIDSNSNVNNKDAGYVENQQQNIAHAIDLLPRLATGIDVNIKFRRIDDFEFTPECAIFDLLDIPLYHGWIVDPQDYKTANAIGLKSYNALMEELATLETQNMEGENKNKTEEDCVDFSAATTATLGVPSPCLSKARSFDDSPRSASEHIKERKRDLEEEAELLRALELSEAVLPTSVDDSLIANINGVANTVNSDESICPEKVMPQCSVVTLEGRIGTEKHNIHQPDPYVSVMGNALSNDSNDLVSFKIIPGKAASQYLKTDGENHLDQSMYMVTGEHILCNDAENSGVDTLVQMESVLSHGKDAASVDEKNHVDISHGGDKIKDQSVSTNDVDEPADDHSGSATTQLSCRSAPNADSDSSSGSRQHIDVPEAFTSSVDGSEPIYEGEECILDSGATNLEDGEPMYEGEVMLAEQADKSTLEFSNVKSKNEITPQQGELIRNFLKNNASQLTFYGLFCLQDNLKERELCVFFRNNHFSTMFKYDGELYLLATDQGYINQPDLVWEKLNEVNGDTLFMTGNFKEFKVDSHANETWDESNVVASTADYLASIDSAAQAGLDVNSDLQLAIALQQQEYEQQPQHNNLHQPSTTGSSRLIMGPQVSKNTGRNSSSSPKADAKLKDKCTVM